MDPAPAPYTIRIKGHLGATVLSAFPAMSPQRHAAHTVLTGHLDRSALYGVLAVIETLGLDLLEVRRLTQERAGEADVSGDLDEPLTYRSALVEGGAQVADQAELGENDRA